jgi:hypothetical protein
MVIVTAVYADPLQLERFFVKLGGSRPLIIFSHSVRLAKRQGSENGAVVAATTT